MISCADTLYETKSPVKKIGEMKEVSRIVFCFY